MKKTIVFLFAVMLFLLSFSEKENYYIPKESIRYRIIANSNTMESQSLKWNINYELIPTLDSILKNSSTISMSRQEIINNLSRIENSIKKYTNNYDINFGYNYFPEKTYKGVVYPEGNYESLVITLGDGLGDNWWCVMFPPLCLLDASSSDANNAEYKSFIKTIINKYF